MNREAFYAALRSRASNLFGTSLSQHQVDRIEAVLNGLESRRVPLNQAAYILGTAYHESDRFRTMEEYASGAAYEGRRDLGNVEGGDGRRFKGRGLVQITGRTNYTDWSKRLSVDLVGKPHLAAELRYAVPILIDGMLQGTFTTRALPRYVNDKVTDYIEARRVVNGTDRAALIAGHAVKIAEALKGAGYSVAAQKPAQTVPPIPAPKPAPTVETPPTASPEPSTGNALVKVLAVLLAGGLAAAAKYLNLI